MMVGMTDETPPRPSDPLSAERFDAAYAGTPPWDIGRPQPAFQRLADAGELHGNVLDCGCGTGEHALLAASAGAHATGIDFAPTAIAIARHKARERALTVRFEVADALHLQVLGEAYDTILDMGLFHVFSDEERPQYATSLHAVMRPGARYFMLCFSDREPGTWGPRRIRQDEIRSTFAAGWRIESIEPTEVTTTGLDSPNAHAWLAIITRL
jgi:cyclopropane fatty-acyl-phospholipid synthase-like methyltransferase